MLGRYVDCAGSTISTMLPVGPVMSIVLAMGTLKSAEAVGTSTMDSPNDPRRATPAVPRAMLCVSLTLSLTVFGGGMATHHAVLTTLRFPRSGDGLYPV